MVDVHHWYPTMACAPGVCGQGGASGQRETMLLVLAVYLGLCVGLLLPIAIAQALFRDPSSAWHQLYRPARIAFWVLC
eukprot:33883-Eustigmatos_ZCMA.PRE.1